MHRNRMTWMAAVLGTAAASSLLGCGKNMGPDIGSASVSVHALSIDEIAGVTVQVQGATMSAPLTVPLVKSGQQFSAVVSSLPIGSDYTFSASAKDGGGTQLYHGSVSGQTIEKNKTANIVINMNQDAAPVGLVNEAPVVDALTATALLVSSGDTVTIKATAHDPDAGDTAGMAWLWDSSCVGSLGAPSNTTGNDTTPGTSTIVFTAPASDVDCQVNLSVNDARLPTYLQTKASLVVQVRAASATGNAKITALPNTCPVMADLRATPVPLKVGVATTLTVTATDSDGDGLTYTWTSPDCTGSFGSANAATTTFALDAATVSLNCTFLVTVTDGTFPNGQAKCSVPNHLSLPIAGPGDEVAGSPVFGYDYMSQDTITGGDVVKMEIVAPTAGCTGGTIALAWSASDGQPLSPLASFDPPFTAGVSYTAQTGAEDGAPVTVTVTATCSTSGTETTHAFTLVPANSFCFGLADGTDCTSVLNATNQCVLHAECSAGLCQSTSTVVCSPSSNPCMDNVCAPTTGVCGPVAKPAGTACDDGNGCTSSDACNAGICAGSAVVCDPTGVPQCQINACSATDGQCHLGSQPDNTPCDDGSGCTGSSAGPGTSAGADLCQAGVCQPGPDVVCGGTDVCMSLSPATYDCQAKQCDMVNYAQQLVPPLAGLGSAPNGTPWITGSLYTPFNFGSGSVSSSGSADMYLAKLDPTTGLASQTFVFGEMPTGLKDQVGGGVAVASSGNVGVIGTFAGEIDFTQYNSDGCCNPEGQPGAAGLDFLQSASSIAFYGVFSGASSGTYVTPIQTHMVDVGTGALLAVASNPTQDAIAFCGKTSKAVPNWNSNGATKGVITGGSATFGGGNFDLVVAKVNASTGVVIWGRQYGGVGDQVCQSIAIANDGDVYIAGNYNGDLFNLPNVADTTGGTALLFAARLNGSNGNASQYTQWGGSSRSDANGLAVDGDGNVIMAGSIGSAVNFGNGHAVAFAGLTDAFVVKLTANLSANETLWAVSDGDAGYDQAAKGVSVDSSGNVTVGGTFKGNLSLWGLTGNVAALDAFLVQLHGTDGSVDCAHVYGDQPGAQAISMVSVARAASGNLQNAVFIGGAFTGQMQLSSNVTLDTGNPSTANSFIARATE